MDKLLQRIYDWYILGPREIYKEYLQDFWKRRKIKHLPPTSDCGMRIETELLPLGYSFEDETFIQVRRRTVNRFLENIVKSV